ncbi:H-NS family nucleoid-associated regulatory protein [Janthinobacterium sp. NKUCC06_STL]|uniref:H-NS histone family protein n=1 Tax=Janthinobacterium sp. NKUCC06_STL TaxID=2842127 RepID=UPI001C5B9037|nr:H-NS histone family protein [Janthinobacterium sp. NKUCC06_STL]MBW3512069.1 H-NS histone family protein [Janthinobacterium sp. NKUCC06_STL]
MNLEKLTVAELLAVQDDVKKQLKIREQKDLDEARAKILQIAQSVGKSVKELVGDGIRAKTHKVAVKYRHPDNASQEWSGRGRQPKWVKEWIDSGRTLDQVKI